MQVLRIVMLAGSEKTRYQILLAEAERLETEAFARRQEAHRILQEAVGSLAVAALSTVRIEATEDANYALVVRED